MIQNTFMEQLFGLILMVGLIYLGYRNFKRDPDMFSFEKTNKSLRTIGFLALILMGFTYFLIQMVGPGDSYSPTSGYSSQSDNSKANYQDDKRSI